MARLLSRVAASLLTLVAIGVAGAMPCSSREQETATAASSAKLLMRVRVSLMKKCKNVNVVNSAAKFLLLDYLDTITTLRNC